MKYKSDLKKHCHIESKTRKISVAKINESACLHMVFVDAVSCLHIVYVDATACLHMVQVICYLVIT